VPALVPLVFLVPVLVGVGLSVARLVQVRYPAYGWTMSVDSDAQAMALGIWPFQDPAKGYTGNAYTPLYPFLTSLPDHLYRWSGWSVVVTILAGTGSAALVALLAWRRPSVPSPGRRALAIAEAAGIGALGWSLVFNMQQNQLFDGKNDQLAWLVSLAAVLLVPAAVRGRRGARAGVILLVTAAFWAKQTGIIAAPAVGAGFIMAVASRRMRARELLVMGGMTLALNAFLLAALDVATHGWLLRWIFGINLPADETYGFGVRTLLPRVALGLVVVTAMGLLGRAARDRSKGWREFLASDTGLLTVSLAALALLGAAEGVYLLRFAAGADNDALAMVWALAALIAIGYRSAGARQDTRVLAALLCTLAAVTTVSGLGDWRLRRGHLVPNASYPSIPAAVTSYAQRHLIYHAGLPLSFLRGREGAYPTVVHIREDISRGYTPWYLVHALVERRFDGVFGLFGPDPIRQARPGLVAGEQNFWWKLNAVIEANYKLVPGTPTIRAGAEFLSSDSVPMRVPRHAPPALWLARCFGPFRLGALRLAIREGGGLWCRGPGPSLTLRGTPAHASQVISTGTVGPPRGTLDIGMERNAGWWSVGLQGVWTLRADVQPARGVRLTFTGPGQSSGEVTIPAIDLHKSGGTIRLAFEPATAGFGVARGPAAGALRLRIPSGKTGTLVLWSSAKLGTKFDFGKLSAS
jgi:hypothetical protein